MVSEYSCKEHMKCILKCAFGLTCFEMDVYITILRRSSSSVDEIAKELGKDRSAIYKALQNLMKRGFVIREYRILKSGGYKYIYKPTPFEDFRRDIIKNLNKWTKELLVTLDEIKEMTEKEFVQTLTPKNKSSD